MKFIELNYFSGEGHKVAIETTQIVRVLDISNEPIGMYRDLEESKTRICLKEGLLQQVIESYEDVMILLR